MALLRAMPVLQVRDVAASVAFYRDRLGFTPHGLWGDPPAFCIVQRGQVTIALDRSENGPAPLNQYWAAYIYVDDADALWRTWREAGIDIVREPEDTDYGMRDFDVRDPDGHILAFGHDLAPDGNPPGLIEL